jgi:hypothetical protein
VASALQGVRSAFGTPDTQPDSAAGERKTVHRRDGNRAARDRAALDQPQPRRISTAGDVSSADRERPVRVSCDNFIYYFEKITPTRVNLSAAWAR